MMNVSGLGVGGFPRFGRPKTDKERRLYHGKGKLPARGTGIKTINPSKLLRNRR